MVLSFIKNTVLIFVFTVVSCGSGTKDHSIKNVENLKQVQDDNHVIVGANQTEKYVSHLNGKKVGIVANQTSVIFTKGGYTHLVDSLISLNVNVVTVFSPEHGFRGKADAGETVKDGVDTKTGVPITSLYGDNKKPKLERLEATGEFEQKIDSGVSKIDIVLFDLQDVGVRFYTYISTLHYVMEACAEANIPMVILDRPNPNGHYIDGPTMEEAHRSFLGMHPIPLVHGMTFGEYAQMVNGQKWLANGIQCKISVIPVKNYTHQTAYSLAIRPSPNLPNDQSIKLYPSLGLFEGTNVNAGRGTEFQFQRYGAPFLDATIFDFSYTPEANFGAKYPKYKGELCYGEDLAEYKAESKVSLQWLIKAYNNSTDQENFFKTASFTKHSGTELLQKQIQNGLSEDDIKATWQEDLIAYKKMRSHYLIYK